MIVFIFVVIPTFLAVVSATQGILNRAIYLIYGAGLFVPLSMSRDILPIFIFSTASTESKYTLKDEDNSVNNNSSQKFRQKNIMACLTNMLLLDNKCSIQFVSILTQGLFYEAHSEDQIWDYDKNKLLISGRSLHLPKWKKGFKKYLDVAGLVKGIWIMFSKFQWLNLVKQ